METATQTGCWKFDGVREYFFFKFRCLLTYFMPYTCCAHETSNVTEIGLEKSDFFFN